MIVRPVEQTYQQIPPFAAILQIQPMKILSRDSRQKGHFGIDSEARKAESKRFQQGFSFPGDFGVRMNSVPITGPLESLCLDALESAFPPRRAPQTERGAVSTESSLAGRRRCGLDTR